MALNALDCARLTGQTPYTLEVFRPLRNIWNRAADWSRASISAAGISWMSRYIYNYSRLMLQNLSPRQPATLRWPLYSYPPPHFLIGYQYVLRVCNDYIFDQRAYSRLKYHEFVSPGSQFVNWSMMANCTYTINTGAYHRFVDLDNFSETLAQVQQAILSDRIVADFALIRPMRGYGRTTVENQAVPIERMIQEQYRDLGECQDQVWGLADRVRLQQAGRKDLVILSTIRRLKHAYFNYLTSGGQQPLSLPCDCFWLDAFLQRFGDPVDVDALRRRGWTNLQLTKCVIEALSLGDPNALTSEGLRGGAFELRPREGGRAVTEEMRRRRGEMIEQFVDRLPIRRRQRRRPVPEPSPETPEEMEVEEPPRTFEEEVRAAVAEAVRLLQEELTATARAEEFFNFAVHFYRIINRLEALGEINESTIRRWVLYFFVTEHIATTLNYLNHTLRTTALFSRYVDVNYGQVVMRARNGDGGVVYSRVWNEEGGNAFQQLMNRISIDLAATIERAGHGDLEEEEVEQFMTDIAYHDNSGDVQEILRQVAINDADIESMEISFRFRVTGPVAFSQNREIQNINRRVVAFASQARQQRQPLPAHNQAVVLPPL
ncbi:pTP [Tree shrew adenovirus 1]|uniref:pTP n=1 Tax=Tree shrew adenovirus serotype 1 TaxID=47680 RepID=UPI00001D979C|nr:pTP [Tree shrew adenovirus 1]